MRRERILTGWLTAALLFLVSGCATEPERDADVIIRNAHSGGSALATSPDSRLVASGGWEGGVRLWALSDGAPRGAWQAHSDSVNGILFLDGGNRLLTAGYDGRMVLWTLDGSAVREWPAGSPVTAFAAAPEADRMLTGHNDGKVRLWTLAGQPLSEWQAHSSAVRAVALTTDAGAMAASGTDGDVTYWTGNGQPRRLDEPPSDARTLAFAPDGKTLIGAGWFRLFRWQLPDGGLEVLSTAHRGIINSVRFLPDGRLASISRQTDSAVLLLDPATGQTLERLQRHDLCGVAVEPSPDGRFLTTTSDDASVRIWHLTPKKTGGNN